MTNLNILKLNNLFSYFFIFLFTYFNFIWVIMDPLLGNYQHIHIINIFNVKTYLSIDGLNFFFIYLTSLLILLCLLFNINNKYNLIEKYKHNLLIFSIGILLLIVFMTMDFLFFYISFELILIPFFIYIGISGYKNRRIHASYLFFFYTLFGSFFLLVSILFLFLQIGNYSYEILWNTEFLENRNYLLWFSLFIAFAVKIPTFPFYIWLPEAHVEAPTTGSVLLAGLLLKLGSYGILRFLLPIFIELNYYFSNLVNSISIISIFFASYSTIRQIDIKKIIAYSSIAHMNMCILGLYSFNDIALVGSIFLMIGHGVVASGLFFVIGILYNRFNTKLLFYYNGIIYYMPLLSFFFFFYILGNISLPSTSNFIGELLIIKGIIYNNYKISIFIIIINILFCTIYSMWLYNKITFLLPKFYWIIVMDLNYTEFLILSIILFYVLFFGFFPNYVLCILDTSVLYYYFYIIA
uniref:NADH-ubiquinone oxidoreductase chain 4 n=1 Tax=Acrasis kona TaxID=1008807 RepID=A0A0B4MZF6_9EUKA|nr:NADH dehydrogenase subunit 4 [Acrasis kona]AID52062.1 NADH dehydrogenase subunit 4 [Acrasis kona]